MSARTIRNIVVFFISMNLFHACINDKSDKDSRYAEGKMIYAIDYLVSEESNPLISLLPSNLDMFFKDNNIVMSVEGWMGIFKSAFLRDNDAGKTMTLLKVMNKKYYYENITNDNFMGVTSYTNLSIVFDDVQKEILDFNCGHAVVTVPHNGITFDIFYTSEIGIDDPNKDTPFYEVPGVLMEFQLEMNGIPMHIKANELKYQKVSNKIFDIPEGYEEVEKEVVDELIGSLLQ